MKIVVVGTGGLGRVVVDIISLLPQLDMIGFIDDDKSKAGKIINQRPVIGTTAQMKSLSKKYKFKHIAIGIGDNYIRAKFHEKFLKMGFELPNIIHPNTVISKNVKFGKGIFVLVGSVINTNSRIGNNVIINTAATVDHDNVLEDHCQVHPGANLTGNVRVKRYSFIGTNAAVNPGVVIGRDCEVGSGAVVVRDVEDGVVVAGVPAQFIKYSKGKTNRRRDDA